jgi:hypothetical protein
MSKIIYDIENNYIRKIVQVIYKKFNLENFNFKKYNVLHDTFIFIIAFIIIFNTNLFYLTIILFIVSLDAFSIVVLHKCPLTILEKKYIKKTSSQERENILKKLGILYKCNHEYEKQIELLINVWMLVAGKCLLIIFLKTFNITLFDYSKLYI